MDKIKKIASFHVVEAALFTWSPKTSHAIRNDIWHLPVGWEVDVFGEIFLDSKVEIRFDLPKIKGWRGFTWKEKGLKCFPATVTTDCKDASENHSFLNEGFPEKKVAFDVRFGKSKTILRILTDASARKFGCIKICNDD